MRDGVGHLHQLIVADTTRKKFGRHLPYALSPFRYASLIPSRIGSSPGFLCSVSETIYFLKFGDVITGCARVRFQAEFLSHNVSHHLAVILRSKSSLAARIHGLLRPRGPEPCSARPMWADVASQGEKLRFRDNSLTTAVFLSSSMSICIATVDFPRYPRL